MTRTTTHRRLLNTMPRSSRKTSAVAALALAGLCGCSSIGSGPLKNDRFDYNTALADSWKEQILLNIVKTRYGDTPMFLDVAQIISAYTLTTGLSANYSNPITNPKGIEMFGLGGNASYSNKPTIIFKPQTDAQFIKTLMTPLTPASVLFLIQTGYPAEAVLGTTVQGINGVNNAAGIGAGRHAADRDFVNLLALFGKAQSERAVEVNIKKTPGNGETAMLVFNDKSASAEVQADLLKLRELLQLDPASSEYTVGSGAPQEKAQISLKTRSIYRIMLDLANYVEVPEEDLEEKRAAPTSQNAPGLPALRVHSSELPPLLNASVSVDYHGHWFWVDDRDMTSKRTFNLLMLFFSLASQGPKTAEPVVTIPSSGGAD